MVEEQSEKIVFFHFPIVEWKWKKFREKIAPKKPREFFDETIEKIIKKE